MFEEFDRYLRTVLSEVLSDALRGQSGVSPPPRLRLREASKLKGVSVSTLRKWGDEGRLRLWRVGRVLRVDPADIDAAMASKSKSTKAAP